MVRQITEKWMVSPECLRPDKAKSTRWLWFQYDDNWQVINSDVAETYEDAMAAVRPSPPGRVLPQEWS